MRRREDQVVLRTLRLLVVSQIVSVLLPATSFMAREISLGKFLSILVPITVAIYLTIELKRGMK